ncbi:U11/U12 small nuclear ribonucleoprotein 35 kDa protein-like [Lycorma delicatula]|uniref:U11/U12 small nuclear ribonucleoprotein 35 kDa protein-like n=1 Tax=Lycorma delicatula TaxID=130591 RepID=UPI003F518546
MEKSPELQITEFTQEEFEALSNCVSPFSVVYDPLKSGSIDRTDTEPHDRAICRALNADYKPNKNLSSRQECTIFVARLNTKTVEKTLKRVFSEFGSIKSCHLVRNIVTGASQRYAFIEYDDEYSANLAYKKANKIVIDGFEVIVDFECERFLPGWVPRRLGGGFGGKKESGQLRFGCRERPFKKPIKMLTPKELLSYK